MAETVVPDSEPASGSNPKSQIQNPKSDAAPSRRFRIDDRYIAPLFITCILLAGQISFHILEGFWKTILAILAAMATELVLGRVFTGKWPHLASAYISGISVGILIRSPELWPYALCAAIAITSKYVIRVKGRHIWNPSNFAICAILIIAPDVAAPLTIQFGNNVWPMLVVWVLGSLIIHRLKRFHITLTYVLSFIFFAFLRALLHSHGLLWNAFLGEVAPITGPVYQLFIFFMITDPKTTVRTKKGQMFVVFLIAAMECLIRLRGGFYAIHAPYYALTIVGPLAMLYEILKTPAKPIAAAPAVKPI